MCKVVSVKQVGESKFGATYAVTLQHDNVRVTCDEVAIWDDEDVVATFWEWVDCATQQIEGYTMEHVA